MILLQPWYYLTLFALFGRTVSLSQKQLVQFTSPLLDYGYAPAVSQFMSGEMDKKALLLYLPGFDGTLLSPFLQFPQLGSSFDVWGLTIGMDDRSTFEELKSSVLNFLETKVFKANPERSFYIMGESFGALLAMDISYSILSTPEYSCYKQLLKGVVLINPATSFSRSSLAVLGPAVVEMSYIRYPFGLLSLLPIFTDDFAIPQLLLMLQGKALPLITNTRAREAYIGRVAFSLPVKLQFMPRETLAWRLREWLKNGCLRYSLNEQTISSSLSSIPLLIIAGEKDKALPSTDEARRLAALYKDCQVHIVHGSGHGNTAGIRVDLSKIMRQRYGLVSELDCTHINQKMELDQGLMLGMGERYDGRAWGLSPFMYWQPDVYRPCEYLKISNK